MSEPVWKVDKSFEETTPWWDDHRKLLFIIVFLIIAFVSLWIFMGRPFQDEDEVTEVPYIQSEQKDFRQKPENPGGRQIPHQDKTIFNSYTNKSQEFTEERISPQPENPVIEETPKTPAPLIQPIKKVEETHIIPKHATPIVEEESKTQEISTPTFTRTRKEETLKEEEPVSLMASTPVIREVKPKFTKIKPVELKKPTPKPMVSKKAYRVQLASFASKQKAEQVWKNLSHKSTSFHKMPHRVATANLGAKGTFYRLQAGEFSSRLEAEKFCRLLKKNHQDCFIVSP